MRGDYEALVHALALRRIRDTAALSERVSIGPRFAHGMTLAL
jgi:hypothetical protein